MVAYTHVPCLLNGERAHVPIVPKNKTGLVRPARTGENHRPQDIRVREIIFLTHTDRRAAGFEDDSRAMVKPEAFGGSSATFLQQRRRYERFVREAWNKAKDQESGKPRMVKPSTRPSAPSSRLPESWRPVSMDGQVVPN